MALGRLRHGQMLDQDQICEELNVSKAPLRDALIKLEAQGFVSIIPRRGVVVEPITEEYIRNAYDIIGSVEGTCAYKAATLITEEDIVRLEELNQAQILALEEEDYNTYCQLNLEFHQIFLAYSAGDLHDFVLAPIKQRLYDFPVRSYIKEWELIHLHEHERLIDSFKKRNPIAAGTIVRDEHWSFSVHSKFLKQFYPELIKEDL
ncbi:HTH-type transcriptional repressor RspR [Halodesulfovibrio sp. MK-HDV]|nr:HTH-type transcriptional repressor RspR [Halodesulfovibrio sp. MK-HDV]